jgi:hypothetical protein
MTEWNIEEILSRDDSFMKSIESLSPKTLEATDEVPKWIHDCEDCTFLGVYFVANKRKQSFDAVMNLSEEEADYIIDLYVHQGDMIIFRWDDYAGPHTDEDSIGVAPLLAVAQAEGIPIWHPVKEAYRRYTNNQRFD